MIWRDWKPPAHGTWHLDQRAPRVGRMSPASPTADDRLPGIGEVLLRQLPGPSAIHGLWAGTKLVCLLLATVVMLGFPGWPAAAAGVVLVLAAARAAHVPIAAIPRLPRWAWFFLLLGAGASLLGQRDSDCTCSQ